jgi:hypothetical protein
MHARGIRRAAAVAMAALTVLGLAACGDDKGTRSPGNVAGLPVTHFESGLKPDAPKPDLQVQDITEEEPDKLAVAAIADVMNYWTEQLPANFDGQKFDPVQSLLSYDSNGSNVETACGDTK